MTVQLGIWSFNPLSRRCICVLWPVRKNQIQNQNESYCLQELLLTESRMSASDVCVFVCVCVCVCVRASLQSIRSKMSIRAEQLPQAFKAEFLKAGAVAEYGAFKVKPSQIVSGWVNPRMTTHTPRNTQIHTHTHTHTHTHRTRPYLSGGQLETPNYQATSVRSL